MQLLAIEISGNKKEGTVCLIDDHTAPPYLYIVFQ